MKQIHKNIILSAGLLFASAGLMAQTDVEKTDTLAQKVNVAFRTVDRADLMGGVSSVNVEELTNKSYSLYSLDNAIFSGRLQRTIMEHGRSVGIGRRSPS